MKAAAALVVLTLWSAWPGAPVSAGQTPSTAAARGPRERLAGLARGDTLSPLFAAVSEAVKPAVVEVRVTEKVKVEDMPDAEDFLRRFFGNEPESRQPEPRRRPQPREYLRRGLGSGVVVDAANGYILTNYHVVAGSQKTEIVFADGRTLKAEWVRSDPMTDLAVLKVKEKLVSDAPLGDSDALKVGDWVLAIGAPQGLAQTVTAGIISGKGRSTGEGETYQSFLQTDAAINFGNSGGPLVDMKGEVVGINAAIISETGGNEGIGFAIPSNMVKSVMTQLVAKGKVTRGYMGVAVQGVDDGLARSFRLPSTKGALVSTVTPDSPAAKAGLREGDFIVAVAGKPVEDPNALRNQVAGLEVGKKVPVEIYREGRRTTVDVVIGSQPAGLAGTGRAPAAQAEPAKLGLQVATMDKELAARYGYKGVPEAVVIIGVAPGSPADEAGLEEGMAVTQVEGRKVASVEEFQKAVSGKLDKGVRLRVTDPTGAVRYVFLAQ